MSLERDLDINKTQVALLSGITFISCGIFTIFMAPVMNRFEARSVLTFSALCNALGTLLFISSKKYYIMLIGRVLTGLSQALIGTYVPVWINEFTPISQQTIWMGFYQAFAIIGAISGSVMGSIAADNTELGIAEWFSWRTTLAFPVSAFLKLSLTWLCLSNGVLDTQEREKEVRRCD